MRPAVCDGISFVTRATPNGSTHNHSTLARAVARHKHQTKESCRPGAGEQRRVAERGHYRIPWQTPTRVLTKSKSHLRRLVLYRTVPNNDPKKAR